MLFVIEGVGVRQHIILPLRHSFVQTSLDEEIPRNVYLNIVLCGGERPVCRRCQNKRQECTYELPEDTRSRSLARKEIASQLLHENAELRQLFDDISKRPEPEAYNIFQRLRAGDGPIALAHSIRQAELLLPPTTTGGHDASLTLQQLDSKALEGSPIKIPAQPWTIVAGDGIVSELISAWFKWDNAFLYPFIDRECFIRDMSIGDVKSAQYCSPFLVNAICALRSYFSDTVDASDRITSHDMREQFLVEAKKQYEQELPALPTVQGLWILFAISSMKGEDRSGSLYRFASHGMLERSGAYRIFSSLTDTNPDDAANKRAVSKTIWGLFCLESITATNFHNTEMVHPPQTPCLFPEVSYENPTNVDLFGQTFTASSSQPPFIVGAVDVLCRVAVLMSEVRALVGVDWNDESSNLAGQTNLRQRRRSLARLNAISDSLPSMLRYDHNFTPETCFLRVVMNMVVYEILRQLPRDVILDELDSTTVKKETLKHCALDLELMERYFSMWPADEFSTMAFLGPLNAGTMLVPLLPDESAQHMFPRACRLMRVISARMPIARYVMKGWQAAVLARKLEIPGPAQSYFENLSIDDEDLKNIPSSLVWYTSLASSSALQRVG
ncbi:hypothetical protein NUW58_g8308 [Xylaria curta]|uniref:Uncharacterized protein n=1 Tax=Xylaria curta TaxID=42375 RepID=A0ACC1NAW3_9PEZI|nr:hypothetical protein NUW58_g8308 [Xylaria curta]